MVPTKLKKKSFTACLKLKQLLKKDGVKCYISGEKLNRITIRGPNTLQ